MKPQIIILQSKLIVDYIGSAGYQSNSSQVKTFSSADLGAAAPAGFDKYVVASLNHIESSTGLWSMSSMTIDGESGTIAVQQFDNSASVRTQTTLAIAGPITSTSGNIVWTLDSVRSGGWYCSQWLIYAKPGFSKTPDNTDDGRVLSGGLGMTIDKKIGGALVAAGITADGGDPSWIGATKDFAVDMNVNDHASGAHEATMVDGNTTVEMNPTGEVVGTVVAAQWARPS